MNHLQRRGLIKSLYYFPRPSVHVHAHSSATEAILRLSYYTNAHVWKRTRSIGAGTAKVTLTFSPTTLNIPRARRHSNYADHDRPIASKKKLTTSRWWNGIFIKGRKNRNVRKSLVRPYRDTYIALSSKFSARPLQLLRCFIFADENAKHAPTRRRKQWSYDR